MLSSMMAAEGVTFEDLDGTDVRVGIISTRSVRASALCKKVQDCGIVSRIMLTDTVDVAGGGGAMTGCIHTIIAVFQPDPLIH